MRQKDTPADIIWRMNREIAAALQMPAVAKRLEERGAMPETMTPGKFGERMVAEQEKWMESRARHRRRVTAHERMKHAGQERSCHFFGFSRRAVPRKPARSGNAA